MKKLFLFLSALIVSCTLFADTATYTITWDTPTQANYDLLIYRWEGLDTLSCPFADGQMTNEGDANYFKTISPYIPAHSFTGQADGKRYFSIMAQHKYTVNGNYSNTTWATVEGSNSHFRLTDDKSVPIDPENVIIKK